MTLALHAPGVLDDIDDLLSDHRVAGVSLAVIEDGAIVLERAWGERDIGTGQPVTPGTLFQAGSISKPVAAVGALRLVEAGVIALDGDVNDALTSWLVPSVAGLRPVITPRMLMTHLAGLTVHGFPGYRADEMVSVLDVLHGRGNTPPVLTDGMPGLCWRYSGGGTTILQQVMTDLTGEPFPQLMRRLVLEPAGMTRSTYEQPLPSRLRSSAASAHQDLQPWPGGWDSFPEMAAAGLWATAADLARFCLAVAGAYRADRRDALLGPKIASEMLSSQPQAPPGMGLGPFLSTSGPLAFSHGGGQSAGFACNMACAADGSIGAVAMTNSAEGMGVAHEILRRIGATREVELPPSTDWRTQADSDSGLDLADQTTTPGRATPGRATPGRYLLGSMTILVEGGDGRLGVTFGQQPVRTFVRGSDSWRTPGLDTSLRFNRDGLVVRQYGQEFLFALGDNQVSP